MTPSHHPPLPPSSSPLQVGGKKIELAAAELAAHSIVKRIAEAERNAQLAADLSNISDTALSVVKARHSLPRCSLESPAVRPAGPTKLTCSRRPQEGAQEELVALRTRLVATEAALNGSRAAHAQAVQRALNDFENFKARVPRARRPLLGARLAEALRSSAAQGARFPARGDGSGGRAPILPPGRHVVGTSPPRASPPFHPPAERVCQQAGRARPPARVRGARPGPPPPRDGEGVRRARGGAHRGGPRGPRLGGGPLARRRGPRGRPRRRRGAPAQARAGPRRRAGGGGGGEGPGGGEAAGGEGRGGGARGGAAGRARADAGAAREEGAREGPESPTGLSVALFPPQQTQGEAWVLSFCFTFAPRPDRTSRPTRRLRRTRRLQRRRRSTSRRWSG